MPVESLSSNEPGLAIENGEAAFRRIAARKLPERGYPESEIPLSIARLLAKPMKIQLDEQV